MLILVKISRRWVSQFLQTKDLVPIINWDTVIIVSLPFLIPLLISFPLIRSTHWVRIVELLGILICMVPCHHCIVFNFFHYLRTPSYRYWLFGERIRRMRLGLLYSEGFVETLILFVNLRVEELSHLGTLEISWSLI